MLRGDWDKCLVSFFGGKQNNTFMNVRKNAERLWGKMGLDSVVLSSDDGVFYSSLIAFRVGMLYWSKGLGT